MIKALICYLNVYIIFFFSDHNLPKEQKDSLRKLYKDKEKVLNTIGKRSNSIKTRKRLLVQHGGDLEAILTIAASILSGLLFGHS